jgi:hypothetical protein
VADDGQPPGGTGATERVGLQYLGIGCFTAIAGFAGGGMIAVLIAKIVGAATKCAVESETGAPCNWFTYWFFGAIVGAVVLPAVAISLFRRARRRANNLDRG